MKITTENKAILWSILEKYDGISEYTNLCDALSRIIQGSINGTDILAVYQSLLIIDMIDKKKIDSTIGAEIDACLFSI
jgi:hypothetical protein